MAGVTGVGGTGYRWYLAAQVASLAGTMMGYTALFWLVLHIRPGGAPALAAVDAALSLPMLLFSRSLPRRRHRLGRRDPPGAGRPRPGHRCLRGCHAPEYQDGQDNAR